MFSRLAVICCAALMLAGCSLPDFDGLFDFSGDSQMAAATPAPAPAPPAAPGAPDPFCSSVAREDAQRGGFDAATQARMLQRSYQQCMEVFRSQ